MKYAVASSIVLLALSGCSLIHRTPKTVQVTAQPGPSQAKVDVLTAGAASKAAAAVNAGIIANAHNAPGNAQIATDGALNEAASYLPPATPADEAAALKSVNAALAGDLTAARKGWADSQTEAAQIAGQLTQFKADADRERQENAKRWTDTQNEWKASLDAERAKAKAQQRTILNWVFHGFGAASIIFGILCFTALASYPFAGVKVGLGALAAGAASIACGIAVNWVLDHPVYALVAVGVPLLAAIVFAVANHWWHTHPLSPLNLAPKIA